MLCNLYMEGRTCHFLTYKRTHSIAARINLIGQMSCFVIDCIAIYQTAQAVDVLN